MQPPFSATAVRVDVGKPRFFTTGAVAVMCLYGLFLMVPVLVSLAAVSVLQLGVLTWLIPLLTLAAATFLLPFGFGNPHAAKLARALPRPIGAEHDPFTVQLTLTPRVRSGLRALVEDADDIGWLMLDETALVFAGDSIQLSIPYDKIEEVRSNTIGLRGLFLYPSVSMNVAGLSGFSSLKVAERSAWSLPAARGISRDLIRRLRLKLPAGK